MSTLVIYGIFDRRTDRCVKVGSTVKLLSQRVKGYKIYSWYSEAAYEHRPLWMGEVNEEGLHFIRAAKEAAWIGRMHTWRDEGGKNQMNPVFHALGNDEFFSEISAAGGRIGGKNDLKDGTNRIDHLKRIARLSSHDDRVRSGASGRGECKSRKGHPMYKDPIRGQAIGRAKKGHQMYKEPSFRESCRKGGFETHAVKNEEGKSLHAIKMGSASAEWSRQHPKEARERNCKGAHIARHVNQGIVSLSCSLCYNEALANAALFKPLDAVAFIEMYLQPAAPSSWVDAVELAA